MLEVTGQASLHVDNTTVSAELLNAAPGFFFAIRGIVISIMTAWKGVSIAFRPDEAQPGSVLLFSISE